MSKDMFDVSESRNNLSRTPCIETWQKWRQSLRVCSTLTLSNISNVSNFRDTSRAAQLERSMTSRELRLVTSLASPAGHEGLQSCQLAQKTRVLLFQRIYPFSVVCVLWYKHFDFSFKLVHVFFLFASTFLCRYLENKYVFMNARLIKKNVLLFIHLRGF